MQEKVAAVRSMLAELDDIQKRPLARAAEDMAIWIETKLPKADELLDELAVELDAEYPDQQRILNHEIEERVVHETNQPYRA